MANRRGDVRVKARPGRVLLRVLWCIPHEKQRTRRATDCTAGAVESWGREMALRLLLVGDYFLPLLTQTINTQCHDVARF